MEFIWVIPSTLDLSRLSQTYGDDVKRTLETTATEVASMSQEMFAASLSPLLRQLAKSHGLKFSAYMQLLRSTISGLKVSENENICFTKIVRIISSSSVLRRWVCFTPCYDPPFNVVVDIPRVNFQQTHEGRQCSAERSRPVHHKLGTVHTLTQSASPICFTCPCQLSLHILMKPPIASTPRCLLSSVLGCLSFRETPHIHLIILISVFSILDSNYALMSHVKERY